MNIFIMKKIILLFIATLFASSLYSHGGNHKEGWHWNYKTKKCHYHPPKIEGGGGRHSSKQKSTPNKTSYSYPHREAFNKCHKRDGKDRFFNSELSPFKDATLGFYTGKIEDKTDVDHIVSFDDAKKSGAKNWSDEKKEQFTDDPDNQVPALERINRGIKNSRTPKDFIDKMKDEGTEFREGAICEYIKQYLVIKIKYKLSFANNDKKFLLNKITECKKELNIKAGSELATIFSKAKKILKNNLVAKVP